MRVHFISIDYSVQRKVLPMVLKLWRHKGTTGVRFLSVRKQTEKEPLPQVEINQSYLIALIETWLLAETKTQRQQRLSQ